MSEQPDPNTTKRNEAMIDGLGFEVVPGVALDPSFHAQDGPNKTIVAMEKDKALAQEYGQKMGDWLEVNEARLIPQLPTVPGPQVEGKLLPEVAQKKLDLFLPKERRPRTPDAITFSTERLIEGLRPNEQGSSFIARLFPEGVNVGEVMIALDKDPRYRSVVAAACYRVLEQQGEEGLLDSNERVLKNSDQKTVAHADAAIKSGRSRDVVVGMVLDMLAGRFAVDQHQRTSEAMGESKRDTGNRFVGGHHSGSAFNVLPALLSPDNYEHYFGEPYHTSVEKFLISLDSPDFQDELKDPTLKKGGWEEAVLGQGIEMHTQAGDVKELADNAKDLMVIAGNGTGSQPISLRQEVRLDEAGREVRGVKVQYIREAESIRHTFNNRLNSFKKGLRVDGGFGYQIQDKKPEIITKLLEDNGYEFFVPEGQAITFGRSEAATVHIKHDKTVSRQHCSVKLENGHFVIQDTSVNGTRFVFSGPSLSRATAEKHAEENDANSARLREADTLPVPVVRVNAAQESLTDSGPARRRIFPTRRVLTERRSQRTQYRSTRQ
jgi:hypothetical protein